MCAKVQKRIRKSCPSSPKIKLFVVMQAAGPRVTLGKNNSKGVNALQSGLAKRTLLIKKSRKKSLELRSFQIFVINLR